MRKKKSLREIAATTPDSDPREASIVKNMLKYLNGLPNSMFVKRHGARTRSGDPDITGCLGGQHWEIEVKRPGNTPTKRQWSRLDKWSDAGAVSCWVDNLDTLRMIVELSHTMKPSPFGDIRKYAHNLI